MARDNSNSPWPTLPACANVEPRKCVRARIFYLLVAAGIAARCDRRSGKETLTVCEKRGQSKEDVCRGRSVRLRTCPWAVLEKMATTQTNGAHEQRSERNFREKYGEVWRFRGKTRAPAGEVWRKGWRSMRKLEKSMESAVRRWPRRSGRVGGRRKTVRTSDEMRRSGDFSGELSKTDAQE